MSGRTRSFDETKCVSFLIEDDELLGKIKWGIVLKKDSIKFYNEPVYNEKYLRTKIKSY